MSEVIPGGRNEKDMADQVQVVEFLLGDEQFAVNLFDIKEVVEYSRITKLPDTPPHIMGIIDLRGEITTIIDLKQLMGIKGNGEIDEDTARIIVLDQSVTSVKTGIIVDAVLAVTNFTSADVDTDVSSEGESNIIGIIKNKVKSGDTEKTDLIIWIDIMKMLSGIEYSS